METRPVAVSFVVPAHNEESCIGATIDAMMAAMTARPEAYEVIVSADGCTDATVRIACSKGAEVVEHDRRQIAAARNLGAARARGDILIFVDADTRVTGAAVAEAIEAVAAGAAGGGASFRLDGDLPLYARVLMPLLSGAMRVTKQTGGAFLFCSRSAFDAAGGWNEAYFAGEEIHMVKALKRVGPFVLVRAMVTTSGRKVRTHSFGELMSLLLRGVFLPRTLKDRSKLAFFYGPRRPDPNDAKQE